MSYWHFEPLQQISPAAALVLAAEYRRWVQLAGGEVFIANVEEWNEAVFDTLWRIGFFNIMGFLGTPPTLSPQEIVVPMQEGETADGTAVSKLMAELKRLFPSDLSASGELVDLYGAMVDALDNVVGHAYPEDGKFQYPHLGKWWIAGAVDTAARRITAVVYDQGVSIPVALPKWERYAGVLQRLSSRLGSALGIWTPGDPRHDGAAIDAAVEESVTSTGEPHRGKGLARMKDFVDQCQSGHLRIISRRGEVVFQPRQKPHVNTYDSSIGGTLIEWNVLV